MTDYDLRARATAARLLAPVSAGGKGQVVTLTARTSGAYDLATGTVPVTITTQQGSGIVDGAAHRDRPGTQILAGDERFRLSALNTDGGLLTPPAVDSQLTKADGSIWNVVGIDPLSPAGNDVMFTLYLRQ